MLPPIILTLFNLIRSSELLLKFGKIELIGVPTPVYEIPKRRYVTIAHQNLPLALRLGLRNIKTKKIANGNAIHKKYGRLCPQRVCV